MTRQTFNPCINVKELLFYLYYQIMQLKNFLLKQKYNSERQSLSEIPIQAAPHIIDLTKEQLRYLISPY